MRGLHEIAYAKINLALHVRERRDDGYHELESLVAFWDQGDVITFEPAQQDCLSIDGPFAGDIRNDSDNLVLRALSWAREWYNADIPPLAVSLSKDLPVAAGLGGGSADAAALLRLLVSEGYVSSVDDMVPQTACLGADVPACLVSRPLIMSGIGENIEEVTDDSLNDIFVVLVNPGIPVPTGPVFGAWDKIDRGGLTKGTALDNAIHGRNDLQSAAMALCPVVGDIMTMLNASGPMVARMSGSGATCFALYDDPEKAAHVGNLLAGRKPDWWVHSGGLTKWR